MRWTYVIVLCTAAACLTSSVEAAPNTSSDRADRAIEGSTDAATDMRKVSENKKKKKKKKKKGPKSSVTINSKGAKVRTSGENGSIAVGPNGPSVTLRPGGGPVKIGIKPNGKPKFSYIFCGCR